MNKSGQWRLSPAYDVCHAYRPGSDWVSQHALSINGKRKNFTREDLLSIGRSMNIKNANSIINDVMDVCSNWKTFANEVQVDEKLRDAIEATFVKL
jgi:serine/threonine-protein kinase HipA